MNAKAMQAIQANVDEEWEVLMARMPAAKASKTRRRG
jgi:hypothetical protein